MTINLFLDATSADDSALIAPKGQNTSQSTAVSSSTHRPKQHNSKSTFKLHTHTRPFNGPLSGTTRVSRYQKGTTNLDFTEARDNEW